jgi:hypothetical protein
MFRQIRSTLRAQQKPKAKIQTSTRALILLKFLVIRVRCFTLDVVLNVVDWKARPSSRGEVLVFCGDARKAP